MSVSLNHETQKLIEEHMKEGGYTSADEVVRAGLESLDQRDSGDFGTGEMDELLEEGERSGAPLDGEQVLAELRDLRARNTNKAG